ncbi:MAG: hypothetical protein COS14_13155 [Bacteroidetes bacterium CG02_land_8_20_14_3_00_31_25]|nr:MAG: hypothetical protein COS14_13155 [Bacteroidetes bacterium CG02_land_8_20_14_3_00_31_25]
MKRIIYDDNVLDYLDSLIDILFDKEYFSFYESSEKYVDGILDFVEENIFVKSKKVAPKYFNRYGKNLFYIFYKPNKRTTWFIFFQLKDNVYLIKYITNNHVSGSHIRGLKGNSLISL